MLTFLDVWIVSLSVIVDIMLLKVVELFVLCYCAVLRACDVSILLSVHVEFACACL